MGEPVKWSVQWRVSPTAEGLPKVDPIQGQFFTTEGLKEKASALVRETIQNSMDAKTENIKPGDEKEYPVQVRFFFSGSTAALPPEKHKRYLHGLMPHILAENTGLIREELPDFEEPMPFIAIEDFNTTGLTGDPEENKDPEDGVNKKHSFYWFWRNVGRSDKGEDERGRWGLGKTVFPYSSKISAFFGLTSREEDNEKLLMGQSVLKLHYLGDGTEYNPYGYFGKFKKTEPPSYFALPLKEDEIPSIVEDDFRLERKNYAGFSVIIPFPREDLTIMEVTKTVALEYFYPIVTGDLEVTMEDGGGNKIKLIETEFESELNKNKLIFEGEEEKKINLLKLIEFTKWTLTASKEDYIKLKAPDPNESPKWKRELLLDEGLEESLESEQERFEAGERIAFKVPVKVEERGKRPRITRFSVFIEKDKELSNPDGYFIRGGITIPDVKHRVKKKDVRFIVRIDDPLLAKMLGDAENPAHTEWQQNSLNFKDKYEHGARCLSFIRNCPQGLLEWLIKPPEGIDEGVLKDIFSLEEDDITGVEEEIQEPEQPEGETLEPPLEVPERKVSKFSITKITGGVKIIQNPRAEVPEYASVKLGYMVSRGSPIKKYSPLDFNIAEPPINLAHECIEIISCSNNVLEFEIKKSDYWIKLKGFDSERDLVVKAEEKDA